MKEIQDQVKIDDLTVKQGNKTSIGLDKDVMQREDKVRTCAQVLKNKAWNMVLKKTFSYRSSFEIFYFALISNNGTGNVTFFTCDLPEAMKTIFTKFHIQMYCDM